MFTEEPINTNIEEQLKQNFDWVKVNILEKSKKILNKMDYVNYALSLIQSKEEQGEVETANIVRNLLKEYNEQLNFLVEDIIEFCADIDSVRGRNEN